MNRLTLEPRPDLQVSLSVLLPAAKDELDGTFSDAPAFDPANPHSAQRAALNWIFSK